MYDILWGLGSLVGLLPLFAPVYFPVLVIYGIMAMVFLSAVMFFKKLPDNRKQFGFYIPAVYAGAAAFKHKSPRVGIMIIMLAMFSMMVLLFDARMGKEKIFKSETDRTIFRIQIIALLGLAIFMFSSIVPEINMVRRALA